MRKIILVVSIIILSAFHQFNAVAQGTTTAAINGLIVDEKGEGLPGATIIAVHTPTGTKYGTITQPDGNYHIPNMRVGGPYKVTVSFVGFKEQNQENVYLSLGQDLTLNFNMVGDSQELGVIEVVSGRNAIINSDRTGAATNVSKDQIQSLPTISRSLQDFTRLTPQALSTGSGTSFAGSNNRYNNISIDGAVNNDVFGLAGTGTPGGQTGTQPISLDAIEEIQVVIAPYDVRQGSFTGGGVNAVTRSGTNSFTGSFYNFARNQDFAGKTPVLSESDPRTKLNTFTDYQRGIRFGGPILKNKIFFFVNYEQTKREEPLLFAPGSSTSTIGVRELASIDSVLRDMGYSSGGYGDFSRLNESRKFFARLDFNLGEKHNLTLRHNYVYGESLSNTRGQNTFTFNNGGIFFPSTTNSTVLELKSRFGSKASNNLILNYTTVDDDRDPMGDPFPRVRIILDRRTILAGSEEFSAANRLKQNIISLTNNFTYYKGKHTFTIGTHNEFFKFGNLFIRDNYGVYTFNGLNNFRNWRTTAPSNYSLSYSLLPGEPQFTPEFRAMQLSLYGQDEISLLDNKMKLTAGVRVDVPVFMDKPSNNTTFNSNTNFTQYGVATNQIPATKLLWSPRVGFNYDVKGDRSLQLRGGIGIFTGRVPFVWISNQYNNTGVELARISASGNALPANFRFVPDPFKQPTATDLGLPTAISEINITAKNFKFPQVFRTNVAVDKKLPWGLVATLEGIYSKTLNNIYYRDLNIGPSTARLEGADNRPIYPGTNPSTNPNSPALPRRTSVDNKYTNVLLLENTNKGYSYTLTAQLQKPFSNGLTASIAYTFGESKDVNSGTSSQAISNWRFTPNVNGLNSVGLAYSDFDVRHRVMGYVTYQKEFIKKHPTTISLFYSGRSGRGISYIYTNDLNREDLENNRSNDLIYVPKDASEIIFVNNNRGTSDTFDDFTPQQQWNLFNQFISGNKYLNSRRGKYAERNGGRTPFQHQFDLRIMQDIAIYVKGKRNAFQITLDIFNVGNLLNRDWGKQYFVSNQTFQLLRFAGLQPNTNKPTFTFEPVAYGKPWALEQIDSRWQAQLGIRYTFN